MIARLAALLGVDPGRVSVKATTTEKLGFTGRGEGIAAQAVVSILVPEYPVAGDRETMRKFITLGGACGGQPDGRLHPDTGARWQIRTRRFRRWSLRLIPKPPMTAEPLMWQPGHWDWNGSGYVWAKGQYVPPPAMAACGCPDGGRAPQSGWSWMPPHWMS